jgi:hypothetical protein
MLGIGHQNTFVQTVKQLKKLWMEDIKMDLQEIAGKGVYLIHVP